MINTEFFDAHCDYLWKKANGQPSALDNVRNTGRFVFAVFEKGKVLNQIEIFGKRENARIAFEGLSWVKNREDVQKIKNAEPLYVSPTWNIKNSFGGSCLDDGALTDLGKRVLREFDRCGIYIDLAHSGEKMFYDVCDVCENVMFSHGCVREIKDSCRNLKREQIKLLIERNGFFGLTFYNAFAGETLDDLFKHIEYVLDMGGEDILGLGSDIDGCEKFVYPLFDVKSFEIIKNEAEKRNYPSEIIRKIMYKNLETRENCKKTKKCEKSKKNR